jgi:hypothetical protein
MFKMSLMKRRTILKSISAAAFLPATNLFVSAKESLAGADASLVYELRVYHCFEGKLPDLHRRFREHTMKIFEKHGIKNIGYFTPIDEPQKSNTLYYIIAHPSREAATENFWPNAPARKDFSLKIHKNSDSCRRAGDIVSARWANHL